MGDDGGSNAYAERLGITAPRLEVLAARPYGVTYFELLVGALLAHGRPLTLDEVLYAVHHVKPAEHPDFLRVSLMKSWGGRPPVVKDAEGRYALDLGSHRLRSFLRRLDVVLPAPPPPTSAPAAPGSSPPRAPRRPRLAKEAWRGVVVSVQPRIRLTRSFDERSHSYLGYVLRVHGELDAEERDFLVAIGEGAQAKHEFRVGDEVAGLGERVEDPDREVADLYRASALKVGARGPQARTSPPPTTGVPPPLPEYRARGHRRLAPLTYAAKCTACLWGAEMAVDLVVDPWNASRRRHRRETFCYGPKSCPLYAAGPPRKVPGRHGASWTEADWVDEEATRHRGPDE